MNYSKPRNKNLRVIRTARTLFSINFWARMGYYPLIKAITPSDEIRRKIKVVQNKKTGAISLVRDYRSNIGASDNFNIVIDWTYYYPYNFRSPFAAYLIPKDLKIGERVFIKDLIQDYPGLAWNQGDTLRLKSCEAKWNGEDLIIDFDPNVTTTRVVG